VIIGIYFFKDGDHLKRELKSLMDNNVVKGGEYQLTDALENMKQQGVVFRPGTVDHWMDCGNKNATVETNRMILEFEKDQMMVSDSANIENSILIQPVQISDGVNIVNSVVGPHVSIGKNAQVNNTRLSNSIVRSDSSINNAVIENSLIGMHTTVALNAMDLSMGDFSTMN